jgi:8-oxo-dGTP diphosphatase
VNLLNILKNNGFEFLGFVTPREEEIHLFNLLAGSFAIIKCGNKYLMCYNIWREQWELPSGQREEGETPEECAIRELYEETGQCVEKMKFKGLLKVKNLSIDTVKYNPVYFASVENLQPFQKNDETSQIRLWDLKEEIGCVDEVDIRIFDFIND